MTSSSQSLLDLAAPYRGALIELTSFGKFFIHADHGEGGPVWDGETWRGFGMAEMYPDYRSAFLASRKANAALRARAQEQSA